jgi:quercetin dioxygenase-like cupin family protein
MARAQMQSSSRPGVGHESIEGTLDTPALEFDLIAEIKKLREELLGQSSGRSARTLVKHPDFRVVLIALKAGAQMHEHHATARISVQTIEGHIRLHLAERTVDLPAGRILALDQCLRHDVEALEDSAFLLTAAWPPENVVEGCKTQQKAKV